MDVHLELPVRYINDTFEDAFLAPQLYSSQFFCLQVAGYVRKHFTFDQYAARRARLYIKRGGMSGFDRAILPVHSSIEIKNFRGALQLLRIARCHVSSGADSLDDSREYFGSNAPIDNPESRGQPVFGGGEARNATCQPGAGVLDRRKTRTHADTKINSDASESETSSSVLENKLRKLGAQTGHVPTEVETTGGGVEGVDEPPGTVPIVDDDSAMYIFCLAQSLVGVKRDDLALECYRVGIRSMLYWSDNEFCIRVSPLLRPTPGRQFRILDS